MFHKSNLGMFAGLVDSFADLQGYVPQEGDGPEKFDYEETPLDWEEFVAQAEEATEEAEEEIREWRNGNNRYYDELEGEWPKGTKPIDYEAGYE